MILRPINLYKYYQDAVDEMMEFFKKLTIIADGIPCVRIKDPVAKAYVLQYWDADKDGYVSEDEATVDKYLSTSLSGNAEIVTFDEFHKFQYNNVGEPAWFKDCALLKSASLPSLSKGASRIMIPGNCFNKCSSLEKVYLPNTVATINGLAFQYCSSLKEFDFTNITTIELAAFADSGLKNITLPEGLIKLSNSAFKNCTSLETAIMKCKNLSSFSNEAFSGCLVLKSVLIYQETPPTLGWNCFMSTLCMFYVPDNVVATYKSASGWSGMQSRIKPMSEYKGEL